MEFLLDEDVPKDVLRFLKKNKFECKTLYDFHKSGITNGEVVKFAIESRFVIITCDSDYLKLKKNLQNQARIIYLRIHPRDPLKLVELLSKNLEFCLKHLINIGTIVITESNCVFKEPSE